MRCKLRRLHLQLLRERKISVRVLLSNRQAQTMPCRGGLHGAKETEKTKKEEGKA